MLDISAEGVQNLQNLSMYIILCIVLIHIYLLKLLILGTYISASLACTRSVSGRSTCLYLAGYFRCILSAIYHPSGSLKIFCQSEDNLCWASSFRNRAEEISCQTCLYLGKCFSGFLQMDLYHNYTYSRLFTLGGGWGTGGQQFQYKLAVSEFLILFQLLARDQNTGTLRHNKGHVYESAIYIFYGNEIENFRTKGIHAFFVFLITWTSIHSVQCKSLAVAIYRPNFFRRSLWNGESNIFQIRCLNFSIALTTQIFQLFLFSWFGSTSRIFGSVNFWYFFSFSVTYIIHIYADLFWCIFYGSISRI